MFEKVNPSHPDKLADRIAGAIVDLAYTRDDNPRIAVEVLLGHGECHIIAETSVQLSVKEIGPIVRRIAGDNIFTDLLTVPQDPHLSANQEGGVRCGDNGIFRGVPVTDEQHRLSIIARDIYKRFPTDGKYIINGDEEIIICQSNDNGIPLVRDAIPFIFKRTRINPLGPWTGGPDVDTGATNRKLGSDMGDAVTGGGLHGKDASKADVSVNIYAHLKAQETGAPVELFCAIGDEKVNGIPYAEIVRVALDYIRSVGGFEKFAEWGLIRP